MVFRKLFQKKRKGPPLAKICPKCLKPELQHQLVGWMGTEMYKCKSCGYEGAFHLELDPNETGEKFIDMEKLSELYPDDIDTDTQIELNAENLQKIVKKDAPPPADDESN
jgi:hypothetical protein